MGNPVWHIELRTNDVTEEGEWRWYSMITEPTGAVLYLFKPKPAPKGI